MSGPGGRSVGRVSVTVAPDTAGFPKDLRTRLQAIEKRQKIRIGIALDTRGLGAELAAVADAIDAGTKIRIPATLDAAGLRTEAAVAAKRASGQDVTFRAALDRDSIPSMSVLLGRLTGSIARNTITLGLQIKGVPQAYAAIGSVLGAVGNLTLGLAKVGATAVALHAVTAAGIGLGAAIGQAAGSAALLPAALSVAAVALATLTVGFEGVGAAIKAAGDPAKFAEALKDLAPNAAATAVAFKALGPSLHALRLDVQNALFAGFAERVKSLGAQYIPVLRTGMVGVAGSLNQAAGQAAAFAGSAQTVADTTTLFANIKRTISGLAPAIAPVLAGFRDLGVVGSTVLADLAPGIAGAGERFGAFMARIRESGALEQFLRNAVATLKQFGSILANVGSILGSVFSAGASTGQSLLSVLEKATQSLADFLNSADGQSALQSFFSTAALGAKTMVELFNALKPAIAPLLGVVSTLAQSGFGALSAILTSLAPVVVRLVQALAPIANQLGGILLQAAQKLGPPLANIADIAGRIFLAALNAIMPILPVVVSALGQLAEIAGGLLATALTTLEPLFPLVTNALAQVAPLIPVVAGAFSSLVSAVLPLLPPIVELASAVIPPLVSVLQFLIPIVTGAAEVLLSVLVPALRFLIETTRAVFTFVWDTWRELVGFLSRLWSGIADTARSIWSGITGAISDFVRSAINFVRNGWNDAVRWVTDAWSRITGAISSGIGDAIRFVTELPGKILGALGDLGSLLFNAGKDIIKGLINGLKNAAKAVFDFFKNLISDAVDSVLDFLGIGSPSKVFMRIGLDTADGFALGLADGIPGASSAARDLAAAVVFDPPDAPAGPARAGGNTVNVYPRADQSEWSIATAVDRALAFAGRA